MYEPSCSAPAMWKSAFASMGKLSHVTTTSADCALLLSHSIATTAIVIASAVKLTDQNSGSVMPRATCALNQGTKPFDSSRKCARKMIGASKRIRRALVLFTVRLPPTDDGLAFLALVRPDWGRCEAPFPPGASGAELDLAAGAPPKRILVHRRGCGCVLKRRTGAVEDDDLLLGGSPRFPPRDDLGDLGVDVLARHQASSQSVVQLADLGALIQRVHHHLG